VVQKESYLLELARYVVLNPLRAGMVASIDEWEWSSYPFTTGALPAPEWLDRDWLLGRFGSKRNRAIESFRAFVLEGMGAVSPLLATKHQLLLGDEEFVGTHRLDGASEPLSEVSKAQRRLAAPPLQEVAQRYPDRNEAMTEAWRTGAYSMAEIAASFGVHYMTVSRAARKFEKK